MKKSILLVSLVVSILLTSAAQTQEEYDGIQAIKEIHDGWLVVRLPGFEKKIAALDSLLAIESLSEKARDQLNRERQQTLQQREFIHHWYPIVFDSVYTFSHVAFIYTHETEGFQKGDISARSPSGAILDTVFQSQYIFATLNGITGDPFRFTSKNHQLLSSPFPNNIGKPGFIIPGLFTAPMPEWIASLEPDDDEIFRAYGHAMRVNRKLNAFYQKKYDED